MDDVWPGISEFAELGEFVGTMQIRSLYDPITIGCFRDLEDGTLFLASYHPRVLAMGGTEEEAIKAWIKELMSAWQIAKSLEKPYGAATENELECIRKFFGGQ